MQRVLDLDAVASAIELRRESWRTSGFSVGSLTWRDAAQAWPQALLEDRAKAADPDSVGVILRRGTLQAEVVVFRGGWADVVSGDVAPAGQGVQVDSPELVDIASVGRLLDDLVKRLPPATTD